MKEPKKALPIWQVGLAIAAALALVGLVFVRGGGSPGEASKEEIANMRQAQGGRNGGPPLVIPQSTGTATNLAR